jgi:hypothetical protein
MYIINLRFGLCKSGCIIFFRIYLSPRKQTLNYCNL